MNIIKQMTRKEYYTSRGFSGSEIDRPDDLVDEAFIQHVNGLEQIMSKLIENSKNGIPYTFIGNMRTNERLETNE